MKFGAICYGDFTNYKDGAKRWKHINRRKSGIDTQGFFTFEKDGKIYNLEVQEVFYNHHHSQPPLLQKAIKDNITFHILKHRRNIGRIIFFKLMFTLLNLI